MVETLRSKSFGLKNSQDRTAGHKTYLCDAVRVSAAHSDFPGACTRPTMAVLTRWKEAQLLWTLIQSLVLRESFAPKAANFPLTLVPLEI